MKISPVHLFFSCSFLEKDKVINDFFYAVCTGLDCNCVNVSKGAFNETPPQKAKELINDSEAFIAICVKRDETTDKHFRAPTSVENEMSIAFALEKPIALFVEKGVKIDGLQDKYATYYTFDREEINTPDVIEAAVRTVHAARMKALNPDHLFSCSKADYYYKEVRLLIDLIEEKGSYIWKYTTTKNTKFVNDCKGDFVFGSWSDDRIKLKEKNDVIETVLFPDTGSKDFTFKTAFNRHDEFAAEGNILCEPDPEKGDELSYSMEFKSKNFNPIYSDDIEEAQRIKVGEKSYVCVDGLLLINQTRKAVVEFRFPRGYGMKLEDFKPVIASFSNRIDYLVPEEIERIYIEKETYAGDVVIRMRVENPLLRHVYGLAWNPPKK